MPGPVVVNAPPVYAPALVAFVGGGGGGVDWGVNLAIGGAMAAGVAWFPLGPGERWHPQWGGRATTGARATTNASIARRWSTTTTTPNITNITNVHNTYINYRAPRAVTAVPATAFVHGQPVGRFAQKVDPAQWRNARINPGAPGIAPVRESFGPGQRNANYRPPAGVIEASGDSDAQSVAAAPRTTTASRSVLRKRGARALARGSRSCGSSVPAHFAGALGSSPMQNVRVVQSHLPGRMPGAAAGAPAPGAGAWRPGPRRAQLIAGTRQRRPGEAPGAGEPPHAAMQQGRPGMQALANGQPAGAAGAAFNGVPRPPRENGGNAAGFARSQDAGRQAGADGRQQPARDSSRMCRWLSKRSRVCSAEVRDRRCQRAASPSKVAVTWMPRGGKAVCSRPVQNPALGQQTRIGQGQSQGCDRMGSQRSGTNARSRSGGRSRFRSSRVRGFRRRLVAKCARNRGGKSRLGRSFVRSRHSRG